MLFADMLGLTVFLYQMKIEGDLTYLTVAMQPSRRGAYHFTTGHWDTHCVFSWLMSDNSRAIPDIKNQFSISLQVAAYSFEDLDN